MAGDALGVAVQQLDQASRNGSLHALAILPAPPMTVNQPPW
jgi:hypothetical protein